MTVLGVRTACDRASRCSRSPSAGCGGDDNGGGARRRLPAAAAATRRPRSRSSTRPPPRTSRRRWRSARRRRPTTRRACKLTEAAPAERRRAEAGAALPGRDAHVQGRRRDDDADPRPVHPAAPAGRQPGRAARRGRRPAAGGHRGRRQAPDRQLQRRDRQGPREGAARRRSPKNATGEILIGTDTPGLPVLEQRNQGFKDVMKKERPGLKFIVFDAKQSPTDNFNTWSAQVKAHPDAVAYVGPGSQAAVSLSRIQRKSGQEAARRRLRPRPGRAAGRQGRATSRRSSRPSTGSRATSRSSCWPTRSSSGKDLPEGVWNSGALTVNSDNIDEILTRQKDAQSRAGLLQGRGRQAARQPRPVPRADAGRADARGTRHSVRPTAASWRSPARTSRSAPARCTRCWGRTGPGKSTLVKIVAGAVVPDSGDAAARRRAPSSSPAPRRPRATASRSSRRSSTCSGTSTCSRTCSRCARSSAGRSSRAPRWPRKARPVLAELGLDVSLRTRLGGAHARRSAS